jgi:3-oxoacyl-[acyl-carrier protein] reductase
MRVALERGLASAEALREEGAEVVMFARRGELLSDHARRLGATAVAGDLLRDADLERAVETAVAVHGRLDILVLNGGGPPASLGAEVTAESIGLAVDLALRPFVTLTRAALPHLRASGQGRIIAISSVTAREPIGGIALANTLRPAVWGYLKTLAGELGADGITVNAVAPGWIATSRTMEPFAGAPPRDVLDPIPLGRFGDPRGLGDVVCFLASRRASYVNGGMIVVDGGVSRSL